MPFQYRPYQNRYVGTIADLMGRGRDAEAQALIDSANAQAQAAQVSGQAWGGAIQGIGNTVAQGITNWNSPEARRQREMYRATEIAAAGAADLRSVTVPDVIGRREGVPIPEQSLVEASMADLNLFSPEQEAIPPSTRNLPLPTFGQQPPPGSSDTMSSANEFPLPTLGPRAPFMQPFADRGSEGWIGQRELLDDSGDPVMRGRYTLDNGQYDSAALLRDLIAAGIPLDVANAFAAKGVQANTILAAGADINEQYRKSQLKIQGVIAGMALSAIELGMSPEDAVNQATPAGDPIPADQMRQFRVMFHQKTPEEQVQILEEIQHRASFLGDLTTIPIGARVMGEEGRIVAEGAPRVTTPSPARLGSLEDMLIAWYGPNPTAAQRAEGIRRHAELTNPGGLDWDISLDYLDQPIPGDVNAGAPESNRIPGAGAAPPARAPIDVNAPPAVSDVPGVSPTDSGADRPTPQREKMMSEVTPEELERFLDTQQRWEGWSAGGLHGPQRRLKDVPTRSFRLNNPGNIKRTDDSDARSTVPQKDPVFQTFASYEEGRQAQKDLWLTEPYQTRTVREAVNRWIGGEPEKNKGYIAAMLESVNAGVAQSVQPPIPEYAEPPTVAAGPAVQDPMAPAVDPSVGPRFDPLANELGLRPNSDGVYNIRPLSPVMTPNLGDTLMNSMEFATKGMTSAEKKDALEQFARFAEQRQPAHVMKHFIYTTGLEGLGQVERDQIKGRYTTQLSLRGVISILGEMKEAGVETGWLTGNIENLYAMIGKTNNPELARLATRLADMVIAYRRAATGVQFGVLEKRDYENMMPGIKFEENLNLARIGGLNTALNDHMRAFWQQRIGDHNAPTVFPEFYPSEPNARDFVPGEARILEDGTRWVMGPNGEDPIPYPFEEKELNKNPWWSPSMFSDILDKMLGSGEQVDPSQPPPAF